MSAPARTGDGRATRRCTDGATCSFDGSRPQISTGWPKSSPNARYGSFRTAEPSLARRDVGLPRRADAGVGRLRIRLLDRGAPRDAADDRLRRAIGADLPPGDPSGAWRSGGASIPRTGVRGWPAKAHERRFAKASPRSDCQRSVHCPSPPTRRSFRDVRTHRNDLPADRLLSRDRSARWRRGQDVRHRERRSDHVISPRGRWRRRRRRQPYGPTGSPVCRSRGERRGRTMRSLAAP